jgi:hypothetical protein
MKFSKPKIILLVCLFLLTSAGLSRAVELPRIDKNKIRLILAPGKAEYGEISVENSTSEQRNIRVYLSDWNYLSASDGTKEFRSFILCAVDKFFSRGIYFGAV